MVDRAGALLAAASRSHQTSHLHPGWQEQDPLGSWWDSCIEIVHELRSAASARPEEVVRIAVTGFVPGMCLLDPEGVPLRPAILHTDMRADEEVVRINGLFPEIHQGHLIPKLIWVRDHEPDVFRLVSSVLVPHSFIVFKLTGKLSCDHDTASVYGAVFDRSKLGWDRNACTELGLPFSLFPETYSPLHMIGPLSKETAALLGLTTSAEVIVGTGDSFATLLGAGIRDAHELMLYWGTSGTRVYTWNSPLYYLDGPFFAFGKAEFLGTIFSCGESLNHVRSLLGHVPWSELDSMADEVQPGAEGLFFVPHLKQQSYSGSFSAADHLIGLKNSHASGHIFRAVLEGIAYMSVLELQRLERIDRIHVCGGAAASKLLRTILATLLQKPVQYDAEASAAFGIALMAELSSSGSVHFSRISRHWFENIRHVIKLEQVPNIEWIQSYEKSLKDFTSIRNGLLSLERTEEKQELY